MEPSLTRSALISLAALSLLACDPVPAAQVLQLTDLNPRQIEVGDRIEVTGHNLPRAADIRRISVTLRGTLSRPGLAPCSAPLEVTVSDPPPGATVTDVVTGQTRDLTYAESTSRTIRLDGSTRLEFPVTADLLRQLTHCPSDRDARAEVPHATLSLGGPGARSNPLGLVVRIEGLTGAEPIAGTLRGPTLDLHGPSARSLQLDSATRREAERVLDFLGVTLASSHPAEGGLRVAAVRAGSPAERAGLASNDVLTRLDGVTLLALTDFRPAPGRRAVTVSALRGDVQDERLVPLEGLVPTAPTDLLAVAIVLLVAGALLALALAPRAGISVWLARYVGRRRGARGLGLAGFGAWFAAAVRAFVWRRPLPEGPPALARAVPLLAFAAVTSTIVAVPFGQYLFASGVDVVAVYLGAVALLAAAAVGAGAGGGAPWSLAAGARAAGRALSHQAPAAVGLACFVVCAGGLRARGLVDAQGGWPWQRQLFATPATFGLAALFLAAALLPLGGDEGGRRGAARRLLEWCNAWLVCALGAVAFLGGWLLPGVPASEQAASVPLQMLGALVFMAKVWGALFAVLAARWTLAGVTAQQLAALCRMYALPAALVLAVPTLGWGLLAPRLPALVPSALAIATFLLCLLGAAWVPLRRVLPRRGAAPALVPDPFG